MNQKNLSVVNRPDQARLLDTVIAKLGLKTDVALARRIDVAPQVISKLRHGTMALGPTMLLYLHEASGLSIAALRQLAMPVSRRANTQSGTTQPGTAEQLQQQASVATASATARKRTGDVSLKASKQDRSVPDQARLIDALLVTMRLNDDAALAKALGVPPSLVDAFRRDGCRIDANMLDLMQDVSGTAASALRRLMRPNSARRRGAPDSPQRIALLAQLQQIALQHGGMCLEQQYRTHYEPVRFSCPQHGIFTASPNNIRNGQWCRRCAYDRKRGGTPERLQHYIDQRGGVMLSPYVNARTHVIVSCALHGEWRATPDSLLNKNSWCDGCARSGRDAALVNAHYASGLPSPPEKLQRPYQDPAMYGIGRPKRPPGQGSWQVQIQRAGVKYAKTFGDTRHGGKEQALVAARAYRDAVLQQVAPLARKDGVQIVKSNCKCGVPGVTRSDVARKWKNGTARAIFWSAQIDVAPGKFRSKSFSVNRYGEEGAFKLAVAARLEFLNDVEGHVLTSPASRQLQAQIDQRLSKPE